MRRLALCLWLIALGVCAHACSQVVDGELGTVRCQQEGAVGPPACRAGELCSGGVCLPCGTEVCGDGRDNDCDLQIDEECDGGLEDGVGGPCAADGTCPGELFCVNAPSLGFSGPRFCSRGCCTSSDCGTNNTVCFPSGGGANFCIPGEVVGRPQVGPKPAGASCGVGPECRSGLCDQGLCTDVCCGRDDCPSNVPDCVLSPVPNTTRRAFICAVGQGGVYPDSCSGPESCKTGACASAGATTAYCTQTCCRRVDCPESLGCIYGVDQSGFGIRFCARTGAGAGVKVLGEACLEGSECQSGQCSGGAGQAGFCTDACCEDADCGDSLQFACLPQLAADGSARLLCVPRQAL